MRATTTTVLLSIFLAATVGCHEETTRLNQLDGESESQVVAEYGAPTRTDEYLMSKAAGQFRVHLRQYYPMPASADTRIRELTWERSRYFVTVWLHQTNDQWIVFDSLRYGKDVQF